MNNIKIATDLDGVLSTIPKNWLPDDIMYLVDDMMYSIFNSYWGWFRKRNCKKFKYLDDDVDIITGRPESDRWYTEKWLNKNKIKYNNLIMNNLGTMDDDRIAIWKCETIVKNKYDLYFDDSYLIKIYLSGMCEFKFLKLKYGDDTIYGFKIYQDKIIVRQNFFYP